MRLKRLFTSGAVAMALAVSCAAATVGTAHADESTLTWEPLTTTHWVGLYSMPDASSAKVPWADLRPGGDAVQYDCWKAGAYIGSAGDVWYHTWRAFYRLTGYTAYVYPAWTFAPYVDGAADFHNHTIPQCNF
ncbi:hypothetical protein [Streptomyces sp. NPDC020917]|uniref:hypothetical protein n=1 Tax=Streptomyces sp. NPDC020917 TaxID=3365102 RepID=UPI0037A881DA